MGPALDDVLDAIARAVDDLPPDNADLGRIRLRPHQTAGARAIVASIAEFGGALLADEPGLGKTFTALAVARNYPDCLVAAPASLRDMWTEACATTNVAARFVSLEALGRGRDETPAPLLIVDEAHHASSTVAKRYAALARLAERSHVVLLTATPVRNRPSELEALLGLFLGSRAAALDDAGLCRCVIRRPAQLLRDIPVVARRTIPPPPRAPRIAEQLRALPPPFPVADGIAAAGLVTTGLARCWASSLAALDRALGRRLQRGAAIRDVLETGRQPTRAELRAWIVGDDSTQLAFSFAGGAIRSDIRDQTAVLDAHISAIRLLRHAVQPLVLDDTRWRSQRLADISCRHQGAPVLAFTVFEATASALFHALRALPGVVLLTSRGAMSAGGAVPRADIIRLLGPDGDAARADSARFDPHLVISTDVLSEGVNLQRASAVVHLDAPWTPAGLAQRTGRVARIGSRSSLVVEYLISPPREAERLLRTRVIHRQKRDLASAALEPSSAGDTLRQACAAWIRPMSTRGGSVAARVRATTDGFIARIQSDARAWLVGGSRRDSGGWHVSDSPGRLNRLVRAVIMTDAGEPRKDEIASICTAIRRWIDHRSGAAIAGAGRHPSAAIRRALGRLDCMIDRSPLSARPATAARVGRLRAVLLGTAGVAVEFHVKAMLGRPSEDPEWLAMFEDRVRGAGIGRGAIIGERPVVAALLILRPQPPGG